MVLLDDPLSALDNIVGSWVFRHAICKMAEGAAIVMSTHQQQVSICLKERTVYCRHGRTTLPYTTTAQRVETAIVSTPKMTL